MLNIELSVREYFSLQYDQFQHAIWDTQFYRSGMVPFSFKEKPESDFPDFLNYCNMSFVFRILYREMKIFDTF